MLKSDRETKVSPRRCVRNARPTPPVEMPEPLLTAAPKPTDLPTPALTLRVCGTPQDGRLVRLNGVKCSIGSDSQCTLRLRAAGVSPFHCLIVRGPERTIVRRWSEDTRLNGEPFTAAMLHVGDHLTVGSVEFEVVDGIGSAASPDSVADAASKAAPVLPPRTQPSTTPNGKAGESNRDDRSTTAGHGRARARRLLTRLREVSQENEVNGLRLVRLEEDLRRLREEVAAEEQRRLSTENERSAQIAESERASLEEQRAELEHARRQLEEERAALQDDRATFAQAWTAFEQERGAHESQRLLLQQELRTFEEHKHALTLERIDWQTDTSRAEAELANRRDELDRRATALEKQRLDHETARRRMEQAEQDLTKRQEILQRSENDLTEQTQHVEQQRLALQSDQNALLQDRARFDTDRQALAAERDALATERRNLETLRNQERKNEDELTQRLADQARQLTDATERLNRLTQELQHQQALLDVARQELDEERGQWDAERERLIQDHEQQLADLRSELSRSQAASRESEPADGGATPSEEQVLARLRSMSLLKGGDADESTDETSNTAAATVEVAEDEVAHEPQVVDQHAQPVESPDAAGAAQRNKEDDESIDNYMAQLLKRVRGVGSNYQGPASQAPEPVARSAQNVSQHSSPPADEQVQSAQEVPAKLTRRAPAPELSSDLAAMRELANLSARAAIDQHAYRNWGRAAFGKLTIALLAAGTGAGAVCFAPAPDSMLMYAGLSSFVVAVFWLLQAGILANHVIQASRRRDQFADSSVSDESDEVTEQVPEESASADEEEYAPAELIQSHDAYEVAHDEPVADQVCETTIAVGDHELPEASDECSDDGPEPR